MQLHETPWTDAATSTTDLALVPIGSTEQHGPHAPLGTDTITATTIATRAANAYQNQVIVTPPLPIGIATEHRHFTGTLWVQPDTFRAYLHDILTSLVAHDWRRIVLVNGHGGNRHALEEVANTFTRTHSARVVPFTWFDALPSDAPQMGHAGPVETAVLRATAPDHVVTDRIEAAGTHAAKTWGTTVGGVNLAVDTAEFTDNGVVGDPRQTTETHGTEFITTAVDALTTVLDAMATAEVTQPDAQTPPTE